LALHHYQMSEAKSPQTFRLGREARGKDRRRSLVLALTFTAIGIIVVFLVTFVLPKLLVSPNTIRDAATRIKLQNDIRGTFIQALGGILFLTTAFFAWRQLQISRRQMEINYNQLQQSADANARQLEAVKEQQLTDRFAKAIDQLGSDKLDVRLGALHSLGRLAINSPVDREAVAALLEQYISTRSPWHPAEDGESITSDVDDVYLFTDILLNSAATATPARKLLLRFRAPDIQLALGILGRRFDLNDAEEIYFQLQQVDLRYAIIRDGHFSESSFIGSHLEGCLADGTHFERATLIGTILTKGYLAGAHMEDANLLGARLEYTVLENADLARSNCRGASMAKACLRHANFCEADFSGIPKAFIEELKKDPAFLELVRTIEMGKNYGGADLSDTDLSESSLDRANLSGADLSGAKLVGASLRDADLTSANLSGADFSGANLTGAKLENVRSVGVSKEPGEKMDAEEGAPVLFRKAIMSQAKLSGAELNRADLEETQLNGADLRGSFLIKANLRHAVLLGADLGVKTENLALYSENSELTALATANFGARLDGADLRGARLTDARLAAVNLYDADLRDTDVSGVSFIGANANSRTQWPQGFDPNISRVNIRD
jgi:uncharacterized protein YjbI with pentapeptide repeats